MGERGGRCVSPSCVYAVCTFCTHSALAMTRCSGAQEVIEEYWATHKRKGGGRRKSTAPVSAAKSVGSVTDEAISSRKRKSTKASKGDDDDDEELAEDEDDAPKATSKVTSAKKTPASQARATKKQKVDESPEGLDPESYGNMDKYMKKSSWESMKPLVETVEQVDKNTLMVFFELSVPIIFSSGVHHSYSCTTVPPQGARQKGRDATRQRVTRNSHRR